MHSTFIELSAFDLLSVTGQDSKKFLQGQVTCNTGSLTPETSLNGALCNVKGRIIADFHLFEYQQNCWLQMEPGMAEIVKPVLDKYIVFSKAETAAGTAQFSRYGLLGNDAHNLLEQVFGSYPQADGQAQEREHCLLFKIAGLVPRFEIWQDLSQADHSDSFIERIREIAIAGDSNTWELEDIKSGIVHLIPSMTEQYLPEILNYDISGVVDFKKGCYTGQEIVARMFYRGTAKKRLFHGCWSAATDTLSSITHQQQGELAHDEIIMAKKSPEGDYHALVILPVEAVTEGISFIVNEDPKLTLGLQPLPYAQ